MYCSRLIKDHGTRVCYYVALSNYYTVHCFSKNLLAKPCANKFGKNPNHDY